MKNELPNKKIFEEVGIKNVNRKTRYRILRTLVKT